MKIRRLMLLLIVILTFSICMMACGDEEEDEKKNEKSVEDEIKEYYDELVSSGATKDGTLENVTELKKINDELKEYNAFIAVRYVDGWINTGASELTDSKVFNPISEFLEKTNISDVVEESMEFTIENGDEYVIYAGNIERTNGGKGAFYIILNASE